MRRTLLGTGPLLFLVATAGCAGIPFVDPPPQDEPAPVKLVNNETQSVTFEVSVIPEGDNLTVYRENNSFNYTISPGSSTLKAPDTNPFVNNEYPPSVRNIGTYTLEPGEEKLIHVKNISPDEAIVVIVYDEDEQEYRAIKSLSCGAEIQGYRIIASSYEEDHTPSTHQCGGISTWLDSSPTQESLSHMWSRE